MRYVPHCVFKTFQIKKVLNKFSAKFNQIGTYNLKINQMYKIGLFYKLLQQKCYLEDNPKSSQKSACSIHAFCDLHIFVYQ